MVLVRVLVLCCVTPGVISLRKRERVALLLLCFGCLCVALCLLLTVSWVGLLSVIVPFPDRILIYILNWYNEMKSFYQNQK